MRSITTPWLLLAWLMMVLNCPAADPPARGTSNAAPASRDRDEEPAANNDEDDARQREAEQAAQRLRARLIRGPYLQSGTPDSMIVRWRTDQPSSTSVYFGLSRTNLKFNARTHGAHTEHIVMLTNLTPNSRYYYALSSNTRDGTNGPGGTNIFGGTNTLFVNITNSFVSAPPPGTIKPTRVWVLGDPGTAKPLQRAVTDGFMKFNGDRDVDLWLMLGDNAYNSGKDSEYQNAVFATYHEMLRKSVLWPTLGNHDGGTADSVTQSGVYYDIFTLPTMGQAGGEMSGTEAYYAFDYANIHFICLDSHDTDRSTNGPMMRWLKADLAANTQQWTVVFFHHPPYSKGSHDTDSDKKDDISSKEMRENFVSVLEAGGVDLVLAGHSHAYERSWLMEGHLGKSTNFSFSMIKSFGDGRLDHDGPFRKSNLTPTPGEGTVYVVAGSSGQTGGIKAVHPAMLLALNVAGSLALDVNGPRLTVTFVDPRGNSRDYFTMVRGSETVPPTHRELEARPGLYGTNQIAFRLRTLFDGDRFQFSYLTNTLSSDLPALLDRYATTTNIIEKQRLTWALAGIGDGQVVAQFMGLLTNKIRDRVLSTEEEDLRLITLQSLGLLAQRYEPPMSLFRKGLSADWWYFRTNWVSSRPLHETAARLAVSTIQALGNSGRQEATDMLNKGRKRYETYEVEEESFTRNFASEYDSATNRIAEFPQVGPAQWRMKVLAEDFPKVKLE
jgi:hypothetical protein